MEKVSDVSFVPSDQEPLPILKTSLPEILLGTSVKKRVIKAEDASGIYISSRYEAT